MEATPGEGQRQDDQAMRVGARVAQVWDAVIALLQLRLRQAQGDTRAAVRSLLIGVVLGAVALVLSLLALPLLVTFLLLLLATVLPAWLAALIVLLAMLAVVAALLLIARLRLRWRGIGLLQDLRADWEAIRQKVGSSR